MLNEAAISIADRGFSVRSLPLLGELAEPAETSPCVFASDVTEKLTARDVVGLAVLFVAMVLLFGAASFLADLLKHRPAPRSLHREGEPEVDPMIRGRWT